MNFGWCYFKRGAVVQHGKHHYLPKGKWKSICGMWTVRIEEQKYVIFKNKEDMRQSKLCNACQTKLQLFQKGS